jgi:DNA sulfur modification protein DndB
MGSTVFYQTVIPARDLVELVRHPGKENRWAYKGIEERMNNDPSIRRVKSDLIPYLENSENRFFGSLIVLVNGGKLEFRSAFVATAPVGSERLGCLILEDGELVVLDGQHRLIALQEVVDQSMVSLYGSSAENDDICVIFIEHETDEKTREIFNRVNRRAKLASRSDHLIVNEDDAYAVIARQLLNENEPLGLQDEEGELVLVNWKNHTLSARNRHFTTLSTVYETVKLILKHQGKLEGWETRKDLTQEDRREAYEIVKQFWQTVIDHLEPLEQAYKNSSFVPQMRSAGHRYSLLLKPVGQIALFEGLAIATDKNHKLALVTAVKRANEIDWSMANSQWKGNLVRSSGIVDTRTDQRRNAAYLIAYLIAADRMSEDEKKKIHTLYNSGRKGGKDSSIPLPEPVGGNP